MDISSVTVGVCAFLVMSARKCSCGSDILVSFPLGVERLLGRDSSLFVLCFFLLLLSY